MMGPIYSLWVMIEARIKGSSIFSITAMSGKPAGLCTSVKPPFLSYTLYDTLGTVVMTSMLNSRLRRSCTISMCSKPKKPQRKPNPNATDDSGVNVRAASFSCSFSSEARRFSKSSGSMG